MNFLLQTEALGQRLDFAVHTPWSLVGLLQMSLIEIEVDQLGDGQLNLPGVSKINKKRLSRITC